MEFQSVYQHGRRIHTPFFVLYYRPGCQPYHRLGITASKKIGCAVKRSRVKRIFREIFRKNKPIGTIFFDIVLNARKQAAVAPYRTVEEHYRQAILRITQEQSGD